MRAITVFFLLPLVACEGITGGSYPGESLATIRGEISSELTSMPEAKVVLVWENYRDRVYQHQEAEVTGTSFPTSFKLEIYQPPAEALMIDINRPGTAGVDGNQGPDAGPPEPHKRAAPATGGDEPRFAYAMLAIMRREAPLGDLIRESDLRADPDDGPPMLLGAAEQHVLVYLESAAPAGSRVAEILGGPLGAGFHVLRYDSAEPEQAVYVACVDAFIRDYRDAHPECLVPATEPPPGCWPDPSTSSCVVVDPSVATVATDLDTVIPARVVSDPGDGGGLYLPTLVRLWNE